MEVLRELRAGGAVVTPWRALIASAALVALAPNVSAQARDRWPVKTREHVDLWLHGFALLAPDSAEVPLYRRGYRDALIVARNAANVVTELDANADVLRATLAGRPTLLGAQFLAMEFPTWSALDAALDAFVKAEGDPRRANAATAPVVARIAAQFRTREERDFLRRFMLGLRSERELFHRQWWVAETRRRDAALGAVDSLWRRRYQPALQRFLNHTQQADGEVFLSTVLEGEGRTIAASKQANIVVVGFPDSVARASDAIYALLHELVNSLAVAAVEDNVTPAQKRSGEADRLQSRVLVRGGAILAARLGPDVADGYMRFYLRATGRTDDGDVAASFARAFAIPESMLASLERQVAVAFGGI